MIYFSISIAAYWLVLFFSMLDESFVGRLIKFSIENNFMIYEFPGG